MNRDDRLGFAAVCLATAAAIFVVVLSHYFGVWLWAGTLIILLLIAAAILAGGDS